MTSTELLELSFTTELKAAEKEIRTSINIPITAASSEIQLKMHRVTLFINQNPKEKPFLDLLGNLMNFLNLSKKFPDKIKTEFTDFLAEIDDEITSKITRMVNTGIFTRFPPTKRDLLSDYFPDSLSDPLDEHLIAFKDTIIEYISTMRQDLKSSIDSISFEMKSLSDEVKNTIAMIDDLSREINLQLLSESLTCWREDVQDLENYWTRKIYSCETILSNKFNYLNNELNKLIKIVIQCLKQ
ncbi:MAG: hypothetical protein ACW964_14290 [Candidatus Hodarchaeales archaeon]|jgi:hypothetical protein